MTDKINLVGMHGNISNVLNILWNDEELLRLLYYKPEDISKNRPDPLDPSLDNILDIDANWKIRKDLIATVHKSDDLINQKKNILYVYLGDRRPDYNSYLVAKQEVVIDIICHSDFEDMDFRSTRIGDRLNKLFSLERVFSSMGKVEYVGGKIIDRVPSQFVGYKHIYRLAVMKK